MKMQVVRIIINQSKRAGRLDQMAFSITNITYVLIHLHTVTNNLPVHIFLTQIT